MNTKRTAKRQPSWLAHYATLKYETIVQTYLLKMARSGEDGEKLFILLESGMRFHTTQARPLALHS